MTLNAAGAIVIREARPSDAASWERLRRQLWPDGANDHAPEIAMFFAGHSFRDLAAVLMAERNGAIAGFAELSVRDDVPGLLGKRTGYVEGLYVVPELRQRAIAVKLLQASRRWAHEQKCEAFASDRAERIVIDKSFGKERSASLEVS